MADLLKDMYSREYLEKLAANVVEVYPDFDSPAFIASILDETWANLELKGRMRQITLNLGKYLPQDYATAIAIIDQVIKSYGSWLEGFCMYFPDFVEVYGQGEEHWDISIGALARYTPHCSSEFAVRPFIINHEEAMMDVMYAWSKDENEHVRRLASEGCRPALPWAQALPRFKKDPTPILPILEQLKTDPAMYVRKSVANNLNDISKTHPELVANLAKDWYGKQEDTDWIVKHACRTLLKQGRPEVLAIFGFSDVSSIAVGGFTIEENTVFMGGTLDFSFDIAVEKATKVRLEYGIDFVKANGKTSRKIFQISEIECRAGQKKSYTKSHSFVDLSTRKHYAGVHAISLIVNGVPQNTLEFELKHSM